MCAISHSRAKCAAGDFTVGDYSNRLVIKCSMNLTFLIYIYAVSLLVFKMFYDYESNIFNSHVE